MTRYTLRVFLDALAMYAALQAGDCEAYCTARRLSLAGGNDQISRLLFDYLKGVK